MYHAISISVDACCLNRKQRGFQERPHATLFSKPSARSTVYVTHPFPNPRRQRKAKQVASNTTKYLTHQRELRLYHYLHRHLHLPSSGFVYQVRWQPPRRPVKSCNCCHFQRKKCLSLLQPLSATSFTVLGKPSACSRGLQVLLVQSCIP